MNDILRREFNPHPPASVSAEHRTEFLPAQFLVVDGDDWFSWIAALVHNLATQDISPRCPLVALWVEFDLKRSQGRLYGDVLEIPGVLGLGSQRVVIYVNDLLVGHVLDFFPEYQSCFTEVRVLVLNVGGSLVAGNDDFVCAVNDGARLSHSSDFRFVVFGGSVKDGASFHNQIEE
jgi:hypothetical protein